MKTLYFVSGLIALAFVYFTFKKLMRAKLIDRNYAKHLETVLHESNKAKGRFE